MKTQSEAIELVDMLSARLKDISKIISGDTSNPPKCSCCGEKLDLDDVIPQFIDLVDEMSLLV